jgi:hypothetical protein
MFSRVRKHQPIHKGAIGFDGDDELVAAYRGAQAHVKTRARLIANDNAIALAA